MQKAFTLIELVVVMGLIAMLGTITTVMLVATLQAAKKASAVSLVKSEGTYVVNIMTQLLKFSTDVTLCGNNSVTFQPRADDSDLAELSCKGAGPYYIASNSASLTSDKVEMTTCTISCDDPDPALVNKVSVSFNLQVKNAAFTSEKSTVDFRTEINLRNRE